MIQRKGFPTLVYGMVIMGLVFLGCCKQPSQALSVDKAPAARQEMAGQKQPAAEKADVTPAIDKPTPRDQGTAGKKIEPAARSAQPRALPATYVVKQGDSLWWIAKYKDIYNDPYLWPVLHDANKNLIKDPNRITPGMKLQIPRAGYKPADIRNARKMAGARKPYSPPARAVPPAD